MSLGPLFVLVLVLDGQAAPTTKPAAPPAPAIPFEEIARRAAEAREKDQLEEAIRWYQQGTQLRPRWDEGLWYLATLLYDQDHYAEARDAFRRFLAVGPWATRPTPRSSGPPGSTRPSCGSAPPSSSWPCSRSPGSPEASPRAPASSRPRA